MVIEWLGEIDGKWGRQTPPQLVYVQASVVHWGPCGGTWIGPGRNQTMERSWRGQCFIYIVWIWILNTFPIDNTLLKHIQVLIPCNLGRTHWALASVDLTTGSIYLMDPSRQEVPFRHRKMQLACLRYFLPSMLHALDFHGRRRRGDMTYTLQNKPFPLNIVSRDRVPQQDRGYDCLKILFYPNRF